MTIPLNKNINKDNPKKLNKSLNDMQVVIRDRTQRYKFKVYIFKRFNMETRLYFISKITLRKSVSLPKRYTF